MCSNEYIFDLPLADLDFQGYVRSGWWVGDVAHIRYARTKGRGRCVCFVLKYQSVRYHI